MNSSQMGKIGHAIVEKKYGKTVFSRGGRKRFEGKAREEISKIMSEVRRKGLENKRKQS